MKHMQTIHMTLPTIEQVLEALLSVVAENNGEIPDDIWTEIGTDEGYTWDVNIGLDDQDKPTVAVYPTINGVTSTLDPYVLRWAYDGHIKETRG